MRLPKAMDPDRDDEVKVKMLDMGGGEGFINGKYPLLIIAPKSISTDPGRYTVKL